MLKRFLLLIIASSFLLGVNAQSSSSVYLANYIKVWGFVKYYHPSVGGGRIDADSLFLHYVKKVREVKNSGSYGRILLEMQEQLGSVASSTVKDTTRLFTKNDRTAWITSDKLLPAKVKQALWQLRNEGYTDSVHRYMPATPFATDVPAEKKYEDVTFPNVDYQLLALARYWNAVEYLFAYKYMITKNWNKILSEEVAAFAQPMIQTRFEQHLLRLNATIEDTHGGIVAIKQQGEIYGKFFPPFIFSFAGDSIVVTGYIDSVSCREQDIRVGDVIIGIRGESVAKALSRVENYVSASNMHKKKSLLVNLPLLQPLRGNDSLIKIRVLRDRQIFTRQLVLQRTIRTEFVNKLNQLFQQQTGNGTTTQNSFVMRAIDKDVVQVDAANLSILYNTTADDREIDSVMKEMVTYKKAIILDLRCYTTQAVFYNKFLSALGWPLKPFAVLHTYYQRFPGKYKLHDIFSPVVQPPLAPRYTGKVILLVNERTQSQSELITMVIQASGPALVVGTQTAGCDGDMLYMPVPGGYTLSFSGRHVAYPDGTASQKAGVKRNVKLNYTVKGLAAGKDELLEAAIRLAK
ncbi:MAG: hypothetical protein EOO01_03225 [Chitinophagaceae bacterium]|nr:MAG: hypothetical protein EOO01_03225 [Chitinophagaceae bacterium]